MAGTAIIHPTGGESLWRKTFQGFRGGIGEVSDKLALLGWREWVDLPGLQLGPIKAKVDTGARTSCLHAFELEPFERDGQAWIGFKVHPVQQDQEQVVQCEAPVWDQRVVTDSGGHTEQRYVIRTRLRIGEWDQEVEMTLTGRDNMRFRMLIGRTTMELGGFVVNPALSYQAGRKRISKTKRKKT